MCAVLIRVFGEGVFGGPEVAQGGVIQTKGCVLHRPGPIDGQELIYKKHVC